jgi:hypothetical protein
MQAHSSFKAASKVNFHPIFPTVSLSFTGIIVFSPRYCSSDRRTGFHRNSAGQLLSTHTRDLWKLIKLFRDVGLITKKRYWTPQRALSIDPLAAEKWACPSLMKVAPGR